MWGPDPDSPGLAGEMGCVRGQALPCREGAPGLSRRIFPKRKRPSGALWGIPLQQQLQSPFHPPTCPSWECAHPPESVGTLQGVSAPQLRGNWDHRHQQGESVQQPGSIRTHRGLCASTRNVCTSSQRELRPQALGRVQIKDGSACAHS